LPCIVYQWYLSSNPGVFFRWTESAGFRYKHDPTFNLIANRLEPSWSRCWSPTPHSGPFPLRNRIEIGRASCRESETCCGVDGIRDFHVTGVQTCALPISLPCIVYQWYLSSNPGVFFRWTESAGFRYKHDPTFNLIANRLEPSWSRCWSPTPHSGPFPLRNRI